jgi:nuclear pore complex protein Nup93
MRPSPPCQSILAEDGGRRGGGSRPLGAMVGGARSHLEAGHAKYISDVIHTHPAQAALGGSPGKLHRVHAFLRVRLRGQGELDFDRGPAGKGPALDTTWQQVRGAPSILHTTYDGWFSRHEDAAPGPRTTL